MKNRGRFKYINLKTGSILLWKKYNWFKRLIYKLRGKELPYNRIMLIDNDIEHCYSSILSNMKIYTPIKKYSTNEVNRLNRFISGGEKRPIYDWNEIICLINAVRPKTFKNVPSCIDDNFLSSNNYYRVIDVDKESKEYIH